MRCTGDVTRVADGEGVAVEEGQLVDVSEELRLADENSFLLLRYPDGSLIKAFGPASLRMEESRSGGKLVHLHEGSVRADVRPQPTGRPMVLMTRHTRGTVRGTKFEVSTDREQGTLVDLLSGRVELQRDGQSPVDMQPNSLAVVPADDSPIVVKRRPASATRPLRRIEIEGLRSVHFTGDGGTLVGATRSKAAYVYPDDRLELLPLTEHGHQNVLIVGQFGPLMAVEERHFDRTVVWDTKTRRTVRSFSWPSDDETGKKKPVCIGAAACDGDKVVTKLTRSRPLDFRMISAPKPAIEVSRRFRISVFRYSPSADLLAVGISRIGHSRGNEVELLDAKSGRLRRILKVEKSFPLALRFSGDGRRLAVVLVGSVQIWDTQNGQKVADIEDHRSRRRLVAMSPSGKRCAVAGDGEFIWIWDVAIQTPIRTIHAGERIRDLTFSPNGKKLAAVSGRGLLTIWDVN